jgi:DNA topoisomerase-1
VAAAAGLRYTRDDRPGIRRVRAGRGFSYRRPDGSTLRDPAERRRIAGLAVPPAWTDVWICPDPQGHLQATGRDQRGRKQYRYHPRWREVRDADKFDRLLGFGTRLADLRARVEDDLAGRGLDRDRVLALVVRLLDETLIRVGNAEYASDNDTYGLTTLRRRHARVKGPRVVFEFDGKGGVEHHVRVADPRLARLVRRCSELGGQELFTYLTSGGAAHEVTSTDVNDYVREVVGQDASAKDFRTWGASAIAAGTLAAVDRPDTARAVDAEIVRAYDAAAEALRNTRAVCRQCYVHPAVPEAFRTGTLANAWARSRASTRYSRPERATLAVLAAAAP